MVKVPGPAAAGSKIPFVTPVPVYTPVPTPAADAGEPPVSANGVLFVQTPGKLAKLTVGKAFTVIVCVKLAEEHPVVDTTESLTV